MDATKRPIKISPELVNYAEKHKIYEMMKNILELLIIDRPSNPIKYLIEYLKKGIGDVPRIFVLGPPASGKMTISKMLAGRLQCILLTPKEIFSQCDDDIKSTAENCIENNSPIPDDVWTRGLKLRTKLFDCETKGYVLVGYPQTKEQVFMLQCEGLFPTHVIILDAPDRMLIERADGKRIDWENGDIYHLAFDPPPDDEVRERLIKPVGTTAEEMKERLLNYRRQIDLVEPLYKKATMVRMINADQPVADVYQHALEFSRTLQRNQAALRTPRVVLIGPPGCGKTTIAALLSKKYGLQKLYCSELIKEAITDENKQGLAMRSYVDKAIPVPDAILIKLLETKLTNVCSSTYGWILYGYPRTSKQAEELDCIKQEPNRVFLLDVPPYVSLERLCERRVDPITGERYHLSTNVPTDPTIAARLKTHPRDEVKAVKQRLSSFNSTIDDIKQFYKSRLITIDANQDFQNVFELVESYLVNPMPMNIDFDCEPFEK